MLLCLGVDVQNDDVTMNAVSAWRCFSLLTSAVVLSQRGILCTPLVMDDSRMSLWDYVLCRSLHPIRTPHAWPTSLATRKGVSFKSFHYICSCSFVELRRAKVRFRTSNLHGGLLRSLPKNIKDLFTCTQTRRSRCLALRFIRCGVASMDSHSSM